MARVLVLIDTGHGGQIDGKYDPRAGGRKFTHPDGTTIFEGEFNKYIATGIIFELTKLGIPYVHLTPEYEDRTLQTRVDRANKYRRKKCFFLSIHANAGPAPNVGNGFEIFTSRGNTKSDKIATIFGEEFKKMFPNKRLRTDFTDGDLDKESPNFFVLRKTAMPAVLTENFFMDNFQECKNIMMTREGRNKIIDFHVEAIKRVISELY